MRTLLGLGAILAVAYAACAQDVAAVYSANCAHCHGADGRGNTPLGRVLKLRDLRSPNVQDRTDSDLIAVIGNGSGQGKMPGFKKKLGHDTVGQLASYVHDLNSQLQPPPVAASAKTSTNPSDVESVYASRCGHCHGADGRGDTVLGKEMKIHNLQSGIAQLSPDQLIDIIGHGADSGRMPGFKKKVGKEMVAELARYVRALSGSASITAPVAFPPRANASRQEPSAASSAPEANAPSAPIPEKSGAKQTVRTPDPRNVESVPKSAKGSTAKENPAATPAAISRTPKVIDLNSASKEVLMTLPGLTEQDVDNIISGRPYKSTLQFKVRGILKPEVYDRIAGRVIAKPPAKKRAKKS